MQPQLPPQQPMHRSPVCATAATDYEYARNADLEVCSACFQRRHCFAMGLNPGEMKRYCQMIRPQRKFRAREHLFRMEDACDSLYMVVTGSVKSYRVDEDGNEQIIGFALPGDLLAVDTIGSGTHHCSAEALETSHVCEIPRKLFEEPGVSIPGLQVELLRRVASTVRNEQDTAMQLRYKNAEQRLAMFLLDQSQRLGAHAFASDQIDLSMSRTDIANYLGLAFETISRVFTRLQEMGLITAQRRHINILDAEKLRQLAAC